MTIPADIFYFIFIIFNNKVKSTMPCTVLSFVAGAGFEPTTSGL